MSGALLDLNAYTAKLAGHETLSANETEALLRELQHFRRAAAYLASCQAATLEGLPKSTSASARSRHSRICLAAAKLLDGDASDIGFPQTVTTARDRCAEAVLRMEGRST